MVFPAPSFQLILSAKLAGILYRPCRYCSLVLDNQQDFCLHEATHAPRTGVVTLFALWCCDSHLDVIAAGRKCAEPNPSFLRRPREPSTRPESCPVFQCSVTWRLWRSFLWLVQVGQARAQFLTECAKAMNDAPFYYTLNCLGSM